MRYAAKVSASGLISGCSPIIIVDNAVIPIAAAFRIIIGAITDQQHLKTLYEPEIKVYNIKYEDRKIKGAFKKLGRPETNEPRKLPPQA